MPTAAFAADGALWVAWVDGRRVLVASSRDSARTFGPAARVNRQPETIDANGEARPKIAVGPKGEVYVSYTRRGDHFTGDVRFSRRLADGSFSEPVTVNDDGLDTGHRFDTLAVSPKGDVHLVWIDKRDLERAKKEGEVYEGAALYHAVSTDRGRTFGPNRKIKDHVCECCRLALAWDGGAPVLLWRDLLPAGARDHSLTRLEGTGEPAVVRATDDDWEIAGCPHHGPSLAAGRGGILHLAWFTGEGRRGAGSFYRRSTDGGRHFSQPVRLGGPGAGRPQVAVAGDSVWVAWKESAQGQATVRGMRSPDAGLSWGSPRELARAEGDSDHPFLLARGSDVFLSWFSEGEGYRLVAVRD